jgi:hypothetical protein
MVYSLSTTFEPIWRAEFYFVFRVFRASLWCHFVLSEAARLVASLLALAQAQGLTLSRRRPRIAVEGQHSTGRMPEAEQATRHL